MGDDNAAKSLTPEQTTELLAMLDSYKKSMWLGGLIFKSVAWITGAVVAFATFKEKLLLLFGVR